MFGTKWATMYSCKYMDKFENHFLSLQTDKALVWFMYIEDVVFIWTLGEKELQKLIEDWNNHQPTKFT